MKMSDFKDPVGVERRLWANVDKSGACWIWTGYTQVEGNGGHGVLNAEINGKRKPVKVHRISYVLAHGEVGDDVAVCHDCPDGDKPACVNPAHLFEGTQLDNIRDMRRKGRGSRPPLLSGRKHPRAKLSDDQVREIRRKHTEGMSVAALATEYGVAWSLIDRVCKGQVWKHVT